MKNPRIRKPTTALRAAWVCLLLWMPSSGFLEAPDGSSGRASRNVPADPMLQVGEELEYKVSYLFFNLGTIRIQVTDRFERADRVLYRSKAYIDSNPSLSWLISLHAVFISEFDEGIFSCHWIADELRSNDTFERRFSFDYDRGEVVIERGTRTSDEPLVLEAIDTVKITDKCQDGLSLFFYARQNVRQKREDQVPTLIENEQVATYINFRNEVVPVEIDSIPYPVQAVAFDGTAEFVGVAGLTGGFRGWFSNDDGRVPLLARMNMILGSVKVELVRWKRAGWTPPQDGEK